MACSAHIIYRPQSSGGLGERLRGAVAVAFAEGAARVVVVGADIPGITPAVVGTAFAALQQGALAYGPAADGGYYLVAVRRPLAAEGGGWTAVFSDAAVPWGTSTVLNASLAIAEQNALPTVVLAPVLQDVDEAADLPVVEQELGLGAADLVRPLVSVVIPTFNEAANLPATLQAALENATAPDRVEVLVVDGGSTDGTLGTLQKGKVLAAKRGVALTAVEGPRGRAAQQMEGAARAKGQILLFLHADTLLPPAWDTLVRDCLQQHPAVAVGAFAFALDVPPGLSWWSRLSLRLITWGANLRARRHQLPYGDQALFFRASTFRRVGGFQPLPLMEDFELVCRLRDYGGFPHHGRLGAAGVPKLRGAVRRVMTLATPVVTSARRWLAKGVWRTTLFNQCIILAWHLGVAPATLARWYEGTRA